VDLDCLLREFIHGPSPWFTHRVHS
jgi:hypothetical protein